MFPQRISLDLSLCWYRCNRQYVQGSGKLVLKLPGFRATAPPHLHPFHGHGAFSPRGRCLATSAKRHILKRRKAIVGGAGCSWGSRGSLDTACWTPAPSASPPSRWACSFHLLGACGEGLPRQQAGVGDAGAGCQGTQDPAAGQHTVDEGRPHWTVRPCAFRTPSLDPRWRCCCLQCPPGAQEVEERPGCPSHLLPRE